MPITKATQKGGFAALLSLLQNTSENEEESTSNPDVTFCVFEQTDVVGHASGYGNYVEAYVDACQSVDRNCFNFIKSIEERESYDQEDWLIIITTDHGGIANGHGSQMSFDRMIWLACNKPIQLIDENLNYALSTNH